MRAGGVAEGRRGGGADREKIEAGIKTTRDVDLG
jgi:hypothetical protein